MEMTPADYGAQAARQDCNQTEKAYIFGNEATAEAFKMTAYHFGFDAQRIGTALVMEGEGYQKVLDATYAIPAALVATVERDNRLEKD